ncbi:hypothetical protein ACGFSI_42115 [Streptomyces virginiae]|uniref:hypothetical protein n=1 Tax=Streptomyces virginiae TaxID=1961 RepID=UPI003718D4C9
MLLGEIAACFADAEGIRRVHRAATQPYDDEQFAAVDIAPRSAPSVWVTLADGSLTQAPALITPTSEAVRFFTVLVPATTRQDVSVQALDAAGKPLGGPVAVDAEADFRTASRPSARPAEHTPRTDPRGTTARLRPSAMSRPHPLRCSLDARASDRSLA